MLGCETNIIIKEIFYLIKLALFLKKVDDCYVYQPVSLYEI